MLYNNNNCYYNNNNNCYNFNNNNNNINLILFKNFYLKYIQINKNLFYFLFFIYFNLNIFRFNILKIRS